MLPQKRKFGLVNQSTPLLAILTTRSSWYNEESDHPGERSRRVSMDLDQLHTFLEIVRLKSFSKAAQTCYRTQPAISAQVRQSEQELRTALFERFGTKIALNI